MSGVDVLAIGAHPDDVELGCGGILAALGERGASFAIVSLTRGEAGSRGSAETRLEEARAAAELLGAAEVVLLDCGDGCMRCDTEAEDQLIGELRRLRPRLVLAPPPRDRHPDHERAFSLVRAACFYAGLRRRGDGAPHRPGNLLSYQLHDGFEPTLIVDVTRSWARKIAALEAHRSQFAPGAAAEGAATWVASPEFWRAIEGRARFYGAMIGCELGEPLLAHGPLRIDDLANLPPSRP